MLLSYNWIKQFVPDLKQSPSELAKTLSLSLAEVENVTRVGQDLVLEIENKALSHRPDLFSQLGLAREVAAALDRSLPQEMLDNNRYLKTLPTTDSPETNFKITLRVVNENLCPRYMAIVIDNLTVGESPTWMQERLRSVGLRPINNIVDITNYVMFELGQPVHAFDLQEIQTPNRQVPIEVRQTKEGEYLTTLEGKKRNLPLGTLVISSPGLQTQDYPFHPSPPIALAGIMGGARTRVNENTTTILLEAANFEMSTVRKTSQKLGFRTEASLRFEKGLDPNLAKLGLYRCIELIRDLSGGKIASEVLDYYPSPVKPHRIVVNLDQTRKFLGVPLSNTKILDYWKRLGLKITPNGKVKKAAPSVTVTIPTFRRDLKIPQDLYEEVARLHGYDNFTPTLPVKPIAPPPENKEWKVANRVRSILVGLGLDEVLTYSFVSEEMLRKHSSFKNALKLKNPVAPEMAYLRTSLLPSLEEKVKENAKRFHEFGIFEIGKVTQVTKKSKLPSEPKMLAVAYYARNKDEKQAYLHVKGIWETLLNTLNVKALPPDLKALEAPLGVAFGWETELATLLNSQEPVKFKPIPAHMPTYQDLSFIVAEEIPVGELLETISDVGLRLTPARGNLETDHTSQSVLQNTQLLDIYQSKELKRRKEKSVTVRLTFLDPRGPLSDQEASRYRQEIEKKLREKYRAQIR